MVELIIEAKEPEIANALTPIKSNPIISKKNRQKINTFQINLFLVHPFFSKVKF
jgi:hypothetical protein